MKDSIGHQERREVLLAPGNLGRTPKVPSRLRGDEAAPSGNERPRCETRSPVAEGAGFFDSS